MGRQDYILRMIEQLGQALIALRRRILGGKVAREEVGASLRETARQGGLDYDLARAMTPETLLLMVAPGGEVDPGRCWLIAELSYLDGLEAKLAGATAEARDALERAAYLYGLLQPIVGNYIGFEEAHERLTEVEGLLAELGPRRARAVTARKRGRTGRARAIAGGRV